MIKLFIFKNLNYYFLKFKKKNNDLIINILNKNKEDLNIIFEQILKLEII